MVFKDLVVQEEVHDDMENFILIFKQGRKEDLGKSCLCLSLLKSYGVNSFLHV